jgi:hypothetical protein
MSRLGQVNALNIILFGQDVGAVKRITLVNMAQDRGR